MTHAGAVVCLTRSVRPMCWLVPVSTEPGSDSTSRQMRLLVSAVPYGVLRELAQSQVRRECRRWDFDWDAFVADGPEWGITEVVHRRAVQQRA